MKTLALCSTRTAFSLLLALVLGLAALEARAAQWTLPDGTIVAGPIKVGGDRWYFKNDPLVVANINCPAGSLVISESKTRSTTWNMNVGGTAGVDWGAVGASITANAGLTVGASETINISLTVPANRYYSQEIRIHTRYQKWRFHVAPPSGAIRSVDVYKPIGWIQLPAKKIPPKCPCPQVSQAREQLDSYRASLPEGELKRSVQRAVTDLDEALAAFDGEADEIDEKMLQEFVDACNDVAESFVLGADPVVLDQTVQGLADTSIFVVNAMVERATQGLLDDPIVLPEIPVQEVYDNLDAGIQVLMSGELERVDQAFLSFEEARRAALLALEFAAAIGDATECDERSDDPLLPADACPEDALAGCQGISGEELLSVNGTTASDDGHRLDVEVDAPLCFSIRKPAGGGPGKFVVHLNLGAANASTVTELPAGLGSFCFPLLLPEANPSAVWNNLGKRDLVGDSNYFGGAIEDPSNAPDCFHCNPGDPVNLPIGTTFTLQGVIVDPLSSSSRGVSVTNAVEVSVR